MKNKIKILWISDFSPYVSNDHAGGNTFSYYFDNLYNKPKFDISLICCLWEKNKEKLTSKLSSLNHKLINISNIKIIHSEHGIRYKIKKLINIESKFNVFSKRSNMISNYSANEVISTLKKWKKQKYNPEIIILEWTSMVLLAKLINKIYPNAKIIASEHDVSFIGFERKYNYYSGFKKLIWKIKYNIIKKNEVLNLKFCDYIFVHNKDNKSILIKNGIDGNKIIWLVPFYNSLENINVHLNKNNIIFFGAMNRQENYLSAIWFIKNVMPLINDLNLKFIIIGSNPNKELLKYESEKVIITGFVDSIEEYFSNAMCFVAPLLLGAGIKVKILEALSSGISVLTNELGIEGINPIDKKHFYYCNNEKDYERVIRDIYNDKSVINHKEVKNFIKNNFNLDNSLQQYENILLGENKSDF